MRTRIAAPLAAALLLLSAGSAAARWWDVHGQSDAAMARVKDAPLPVPPIPPRGADATDDTAPLPVPPVPPRIAEGADYDRCLSMLGNDPAGANAFADAWEATGGGEAAAHCHALAQVALGQAETGAEMLEGLAASSTSPGAGRAAVYGQAGEARLMAGQPALAYGDTTLAISLSPDDPDLLVDRSIAAAQMRRYGDAAADLDRALALDPKRADALVFRGAARRNLNQMDLAAEDVGRAIALDPDNPEALLERGIQRQRRGDREGARKDWERAVQLSPDTETANLAEQNLALLEAGPAQR